MSRIFLHLVNISIAAGWLILAVILLRIIFRKLPKWITCLLWGFVGIRLALPFSIESVFSLIPSIDTIPTSVSADKAPQIHTGVDTFNSVVNPVINDRFSADIQTGVDIFEIVTSIAGIAWLTGIIIMLLYFALSSLKVYRRVQTATIFEDNIRQSDRISSSFVFGIFKPKIYVPYSLKGKDFENVIAHEQAHIKRKDNITKPLAFLILSVYWYNPLVWIAYGLFCKDIELACDEKVIKNFDNERKKSYSYSLLNCDIRGKSIGSCPVAFGEIGVKPRVLNVKKYKKPGIWSVAVATIILIVTAVCFLTAPKQRVHSVDMSNHENSIINDNETFEYYCDINFPDLENKEDGVNSGLYGVSKNYINVTQSEKDSYVKYLKSLGLEYKKENHNREWFMGESGAVQVSYYDKSSLDVTISNAHMPNRNDEYGFLKELRKDKNKVVFEYTPVELYEQTGLRLYFVRDKSEDFYWTTEFENYLVGKNGKVRIFNPEYAWICDIDSDGKEELTFQCMGQTSGIFTFHLCTIEFDNGKPVVEYDRIFQGETKNGIALTDLDYTLTIEKGEYVFRKNGKEVPMDVWGTGSIDESQVQD